MILQLFKPTERPTQSICSPGKWYRSGWPLRATDQPSHSLYRSVGYSVANSKIGNNGIVIEKEKKIQAEKERKKQRKTFAMWQQDQRESNSSHVTSLSIPYRHNIIAS
jgi:hypothetical protein